MSGPCIRQKACQVTVVRGAQGHSKGSAGGHDRRDQALPGRRLNSFRSPASPSLPVAGFEGGSDIHCVARIGAALLLLPPALLVGTFLSGLWFQGLKRSKLLRMFQASAVPSREGVSG